MKIKEVISATGVPEKTIRYYEERGLITPRTYRQNGRTYHDYSQEDIQALRQIIVLRQAQFSLDEILSMQKNPATISAIQKAHHSRVRESRELLDVLDQIKGVEAQSWTELSQKIEETVRQDPGYVPILRFGQDDPESDAEKAASIKAYRNRASRKVSGPTIAIILLSVLCLGLAILSGCLLSAQNDQVEITDQTTEGWVYFMTTDGIMRAKEDGPGAELIYPRETIASTLSFRVDAHKLYVLDAGMLYSVNPDGSGRHKFAPKYTSSYLSGSDDEYGVHIFLLHEGYIYLMETSGGQFGGGNRYLVKVAMDGSSHEKLNIDLEDMFSYSAALWNGQLYVFAKCNSEVLQEEPYVIRYDLQANRVAEKLPAVDAEPYYLGDSFGYFSRGNDEHVEITEPDKIWADIYRVTPDDLTGTLMTRIQGTIYCIHDHYAVYDGDYERIYMEGDSAYGIEDSYTLEAKHTYLMDLNTGEKTVLEVEPHQAYRLNFYEDGILLTGNQDQREWVEYP